MGANSKLRRDAKKRKQADRARRRHSNDSPRPRRGDEPAASARDRYAPLIDAAIDAHECKDQPALDAALTRLLETGPPDAPGREHVGLATVQAQLQASVAALWNNGWEPADVAHVVGRELPGIPRPVVIELIGDADRWPERFTGDDRIVSQCVRLGLSDPETRRPYPRRPFFEPWAPGLSWGIAALDRLRPAIGVLWLIPRLPRLEVLHAVRRPSAGGRAGAIDDKVLARVRALLAKAESTTFDDEADAFTAKAQELMARHSIDLAMVDARNAVRDVPGSCRIHIDDPYADAKSMLLHSVAAENRCRSVYTTRFAFSTVFGFDADVEMVELLFTSLLTQATASMLANGKRVDHSGRSRTRSFRHAFLVSYAHRIGQRLADANAAATAEAAQTFGDSMLPVLASRELEVEDAAARMFPHLRTRSINVSNGEGWMAGRSAADRANLHLAERITG